MKFLARFLMMAVSVNVFAGTVDEGTIYSVLEKAGIFIDYTYTTADQTGKIDLQTISCVQRDTSLDTNCTYVDAARPREHGQLEGNDASYMFESMVFSGAKKIHVFGETHVTLTVLRCEKRISNSSNSPAFKCSTLRPLLM